jgi:hypothetical protein
MGGFTVRLKPKELIEWPAIRKNDCNCDRRGSRIPQRIQVSYYNNNPEK